MPKITIKKILNKKNKTPITCLTAYSKNIAEIADKYCDIILVGDSLGMVLYGMKTTKEVKIESIITHGRFAAVNGTMVMNKGNVFAFADFYEFRGAKGNLVKKLTSYAVEK